MKAISLTQPWAALVVLGAKTIETRGWQTSYRGPLVIHASAKFPKECMELCDEDPFRQALKAAGVASPKELPTGAVIGAVNLDSIHPIDVIGWRFVFGDTRKPIPMDEIPFGEYGIGRFGWVVSNPFVLAEPVPFKGKLSLWEPPHIQALVDHFAKEKPVEPCQCPHHKDEVYLGYCVNQKPTCVSCRDRNALGGAL